MAARAPEAKAAALSAPATPATTAGELAAAEVLRPLTYGEGPKVGILGDTGTGKTTAMVELVRLYLRMSPGMVFVVDDKELRPRFEGQERRDVADLHEHPPDPNGSRVIVLRGVPSEGIDANPEEVAALCWRRVARGRASLMVNDELVAGREKYIKNRQWRRGVVYMPRNFTKGRVVQIADIWGAQSPQDVPIEPFEQSNGILCFKLGGLGLEKLRERNYLDGGAAEVIPRLPGMDAPPNARGHFVLLRRGQPWDRRVYRFTKGGG
ncbi:MAG TPA: ATP-binding protein [Solirubrobacterales bacterium]|nr:ATP-binding protein [Solirubrobacterales bacterium]